MVNAIGASFFIGRENFTIDKAKLCWYNMEIHKIALNKLGCSL